MIHEEWEHRHKRWIQASRHLASEEDPWISSAILDLSWAEHIILALENEVTRTLRRPQDTASLNNTPTFSEYRAHSKLWIMGLYEVCRVLLKDLKMPVATPLEPLFEKLYAIRIPFAKHEVRGRTETYFPEPCMPLFGYELGWMVKDYKHKRVPQGSSSGTYVNFYVGRRALADEFLHSIEKNRSD
ncbi:hypothetical protein [Komagataeibacter diospyri]|uniref:Uncharacterized protein n=1 Tax=Komagataeibacter diospyri TaxID=1932662 RepID=A0A4P5NUP0_9PROT|nr:hypothetical protein [Komagataeibacter diospyri]GCE83924.1 hypothetical protein MSKU9_2065 [Komagataeibacter diospyri]